MAQPYVTGAVGVFVGVGAGNAPLFLGHGKRAPKIHILNKWGEVICDLSGDVPLDEIYAGEMARVTVQLTRYNESVLSVIEDKAAATVGIAARGFNDPGEIGSLMVNEPDSAYQLWLTFPYAAKAAFANPANGAMPPGYRFTAAYIRDQDDLEVGSTNPKMALLSWTCLRVLDATVVTPLGAGRFTLYDHNTAGLPVAA